MKVYADSFAKSARILATDAVITGGYFEKAIETAQDAQVFANRRVDTSEAYQDRLRLRSRGVIGTGNARGGLIFELVASGGSSPVIYMGNSYTPLWSTIQGSGAVFDFAFGSSLTGNTVGTTAVRLQVPPTGTDLALQSRVADKGTTLQQLTAGAADSGGVGFRLVRVPN